MASKVCVLMSTYNGQTYLKEQIDTIFGQTFSGKITLLIRDDGSQDDTAAIIEAYPQRPNREIRLLKTPNVGAQRSFLELIRVAEDADFYFFADQDDVWDKEKIENAVVAMTDSTTPVAYCSNYRLTDMDLKVYKKKALAKKPDFTPLRILFYNKIPGCVMGFNRCLMTLLKKMNLSNVMMHDSMVLAFAAACGTILFDNEARISHRIHLNNVVGDGHKKIVLHKWIPEKLKLLFGKEDYDMSALAEQYLLVAGDLIHPAYRDDILLLRDFKKSRKLTHQLLKHPDTQGKSLSRTVMSIRSKIFFHIF